MSTHTFLNFQKELALLLATPSRKLWLKSLSLQDVMIHFLHSRVFMLRSMKIASRSLQPIVTV